MSLNTQKLDALVNTLSSIIDETNIPPEKKRRLKGELKNPLQTDVVIYRSVVTFLGFTVVMTVVCGFCLSLQGIDFPSGIVAIGATAAGAMAGLLAPSPNR